MRKVKRKMRDLSEKIYYQLRTDLLNEEFPQDELIIEQMLVDRYGVSRTPIREAAMRLVHEGYLKKYPKKGYTIRCVGSDELRDLEECRFILESGVVDILIKKASDEELRGLLSYVDERKQYESALVHWSHIFHLNMAALTGNESLVSMLTSLLYKVARPTSQLSRTSIDNYRKLAKDESYVDPEHIALVNALLERNAEKAKGILREDISQTMLF